MASNAPLFDQSIDELATKVEEGSRASRLNIERFIEPAQGTLRRATSRRHHLVFGRRGSGKSSLLYKAGDELEHAGHPIAMVDLEPFKGHHYPDVLISVLIATFRKYESWLMQHIDDQPKAGWWAKLQFWKKRKTTPGTDILSEVRTAITNLENQLFLADHASLVVTNKNENSKENSRTQTSGFGAKKGPVNASIEDEIAQKVAEQSIAEIREETKRSKQDFLHRQILNYQRVFKNLGELTEFASFLFLDDLYHLHRDDQANVLDYFHRVAKNNNLWLKIGTIKNRSTWYVHSPQPIGLKIGDDADDINLDLTLEKFSSSREFLTKIIDSYAKEVKAPDLRDFVADGGVDRLVIASGGVTRDFLGIFRRSIVEARERLTRDPKHSRGEKIGAEDVNVAAGNYGDTKKEEFQRDTLEDRERLEKIFDRIRLFCLDRNNANIFLIDQDARDDEHDLIQELIDLRLVHHVKSRVTVGSKPGKIYRALLLDISQYTGERRRRGLEMVQFWKPDNRDVLRRPQFIFDPAVSTDEIDEDIAKRKKDSVPGENDYNPDQIEISFNEEDANKTEQGNR